MKTFKVEVPVYVVLTIEVPADNDDVDHIAKLGLDFLEEEVGIGKDYLLKWPLPGGGLMVSQRMELLDKSEDRTPDVYDSAGAYLNPPVADVPLFYGVYDSTGALLNPPVADVPLFYGGRPAWNCRD